MKRILFCPTLILVTTFAIATGKKLQLSTKSGSPEFAEAEEGETSQPSSHRDQAKSGDQELVRRLILNAVF